MNISLVLPKIYLLEFEKHSELLSSFIRFSAYYESSQFKNTIFTLKEVKKATPTFKYISGFNIDDSALEPFYSNKFKNITKNEKKILNLFKNIPKPFYIIGICEEKWTYNVLCHEIAHGLWYTNKKYKKQVKSILKKINKIQYGMLDWEMRLRRIHESKKEDEIHAYLLSDDTMRSLINLDDNISHKLLHTYKKYHKDCKMMYL